MTLEELLLVNKVITAATIKEMGSPDFGVTMDEMLKAARLIDIEINMRTMNVSKTKEADKENQDAIIRNQSKS